MEVENGLAKLGGEGYNNDRMIKKKQTVSQVSASGLLGGEVEAETGQGRPRPGKPPSHALYGSTTSLRSLMHHIEKSMVRYQATDWLSRLGTT